MLIHHVSLVDLVPRHQRPAHGIELLRDSRNQKWDEPALYFPFSELSVLFLIRCVAVIHRCNQGTNAKCCATGSFRRSETSSKAYCTHWGDGLSRMISHSFLGRIREGKRSLSHVHEFELKVTLIALALRRITLLQEGQTFL